MSGSVGLKKTVPSKIVAATSPAQSIRQRLASGLCAIAGQAVALKAVSMLSQVALAWILVERDYGLIGLAYTITTLASLVERGGVSEVLVSRKRNFHHWIGTGSAMSLASGCLAMTLACIAAPGMSSFYGESGLTKIVFALAIAMPIRAFAVVPLTFLKIRMRFGSVARISLNAGLTRAFITITLAFLGFGAFSFAIAEVAAATVATCCAWRSVKADFRPTFSMRFWKSLFSRSKSTLFSGLAYFCISQGDYVVLGSQIEAELVGIYFFAFSLASQFMFTFTSSIVEVFTAAIVALTREPDRQFKAICKSANVLISLISPVCVSQAILAPSIMRFLWGNKWEDAIVLVQILSLGWSFRVLESLNIAVFRASGKLKLQARVTGMVAVCFLILLLLMVFQFGLIGAAVSVLLYSLLVPLPSLSLASGKPFYDRDIFANALLPTALLTASFSLPTLTCFIFGLDIASGLPAIAIVSSGLCAFGLLTIWLNNVVFVELVSRFRIARVK